MGHFDVTIGRAMVECMLGESTLSVDQPLSARFGVNVLKEGIEAHLEGLRLGHVRYCQEHPDDVAWARSVFPKNNLKQSGDSDEAE